MTELLSELRRSPVVGDRQVAELLHSLRPVDDRCPRASDALAAFIAEHGSGVTPPAELPAVAESSSLVVVLGGPADPKPVRRRRLTWVWAQVAAAAAIALVAVAVATSGPSRDIVVRPADSSTVAPATAAPADQADPAPRRHHPAMPSAGSRPHRARIHPAATAPTTSSLSPEVRNAAPTRDAGSGAETQHAATPEESGDDGGDETGRGTDGVGDTSDGDGGDGGDSPGGGDD